MKITEAAFSSVSKSLFLQLTKAKNLIDQDVSRKLDVNILAKEAALSKFHFLRCFKKTFGLSPYQYLLKKRLERSFELLSEGNFNVTEVAYHVGFNDIYSFSKSFKKHFNKCPSQVTVYKMEF
ncbi:MAG: helix-turn-helix domain-containing protein [Ginsengibacter sp.]|jgi:AraC-like DNA-binding protein|nr:AraC family transcriptional regulator [Hanamia sp.]